MSSIIGTDEQRAPNLILREMVIPLFCMNEDVTVKRKINKRRNGITSTKEGTRFGSVVTNNRIRAIIADPAILAFRFIFLFYQLYKEKYCTYCTVQYFSYVLFLEPQIANPPYKYNLISACYLLA